MARLFTPEEDALTDDATVRQLLILDKLASIIGSGNESQDVRIPLEKLIGRHFDHIDKARIYNQLKRLKPIFRKLSIDDDHLRMRLSPAAVTFFAKTAKRDEGSLNGPGTLFGNAMLALKRAIGVKSDVFYREKHTVENFNYGESTSYLDRAFRDFWVAHFSDEPRSGIRRTIQMHPDKAGSLRISQSICGRSCRGDELGSISIPDFLDPAISEGKIAEMARIAHEGLEAVMRKEGAP